MVAIQAPARATSDPASRTAGQWASRRAALLSRQVSADDPRVRECDEALAFWRVRRVLDKERTSLAPQHIPALADLLRHPHAEVV
jgi:hypothetical protein